MAHFRGFGDGSHGAINTPSFGNVGWFTGSAGATSGSMNAYGAGWGNGYWCILHQSRGTGAGLWEVNKITGGGNGAPTFQWALTNNYTSGAQITLAQPATDGTISGGITVPAWNGSYGGIGFLLYNGTLTINATLNADGGTGGNCTTCDNSLQGTGGGFRGGQNSGDGSGAGVGESYAGTYPSEVTSANVTGGGGGSSNDYGNGGGGGNATGGNPGSGGGGTAYGGGTSGTADLNYMVFGGGGGGGKKSNTYRSTGGGSGGGIIIIQAKNLVVNSYVLARGGAGGSGDVGGGGGAGGVIGIYANSATVGGGLVLAGGGSNGGSNQGYAGAGGSGWISFFRASLSNGGTTPGASDYVVTYLPSISTQASTSITDTALTANGTVSALGYDADTVIQYGHCWDATSDPTTANSKSTLGAKTSTGAFTSPVSSLTTETAYRVRAYATNSVGTAYGAVMPGVAVKDATSRSARKATGQATSSTGETITVRGFKYGLTATDTWDVHENGSFTQGNYSLALTNLKPNTLYYYRPYVTTASGTSYGAYRTFRTGSEGGILLFFLSV